MASVGSRRQARFRNSTGANGVSRTFIENVAQEADDGATGVGRVYTDIPVQSMGFDVLGTSGGSAAISNDSRTTGDHWHVVWSGTPVRAVQLLNVRVPALRQIHEKSTSIRYEIGGGFFLQDLQPGWYNLETMVIALNEALAADGNDDFYRFASTVEATVVTLNGEKFTTRPESKRLRLIVAEGAPADEFRFRLRDDQDVAVHGGNNLIAGVQAEGTLVFDIAAAQAKVGGNGPGTGEHAFNIGFPRTSWILAESTNNALVTDGITSFPGDPRITHYDTIDGLLEELNANTAGFDFSYNSTTQFVSIESNPASNPAWVVSNETIAAMLGLVVGIPDAVGLPNLDCKQFVRSDFIDKNSTAGNGTIYTAIQRAHGVDNVDLNMPAGVPVVPGEVMRRTAAPMSNGAIIELIRPQTNFTMDLMLGGLTADLKQFPGNFDDDGWSAILRFYH